MINQLIEKIQSTYDENELREILGEIMKYVNQASETYKNVNKDPNAKNIELAKQLLIDINSGVFSQLHQALRPVQQRYEPDKDKIFYNLINTLIHSDFTPKQIQSLQLSTQSSVPARSTGFRSEVDQEGLDEHLKSSIYNMPDARSKTLKVLREVLQNAVDATDPKQHPDIVRRPNYQPSIKITTKEYNRKYMDLIIEDHGIGMDWKTISEKFLVLFQSGKQSSAGAAGGFGIAKALIQNTPEHGWSIDTNGIHSNRFHKNIYFGTHAEDNYEHPHSKIKKIQDGTILTLYGLPFIDVYDIRDICQIYGINGRVKIIFNNTEVIPKFTIDSAQVSAFDGDNLENLAKTAAGDGDSEVANRILNKFKDGISKKVNDVTDLDTTETKIKFLTRKSAWFGKLYVMVNGQYQFDEQSNIDKLDIICYIETTARPSSEQYPLDPGRAYVRDPLGAKIRSVVNAIAEFTSEISKDDLLKHGVDALMMNSEQEPMKTKIAGVVGREDKMSDALAANLSQTMDLPQEQREESVKRSLESMTKKEGQETSPQQKEVIRLLSKEIVASNESRVDTKEIRKIIEGLTTPATVMVQKNFVAKDWARDNVDTTSSILILWQRVLRIVLDKLSSTRRFGSLIKEKDFIPGIIYSDECLGLYMPASPDFGRPYPSVSINPMTVAATLEPVLFGKKISMQESPAFETSARDEDEDEEDEGEEATADTPTNRATKLLWHIATHELCHLLYPDHGSSNSEFHDNITYLEIATNDTQDKVREEVKEFMKELRKSSKSLINAIAKQKSKKTKSVKLETFETFLKRKTPKPVTKKIKHEQIKTVDLSDMNFQHWMTYEESNLCETQIRIEDILPDKNNMEVAVDSIRKGMDSSDSKPLKVYKLKNNKKKYVLGDGHHRLLQSILAGNKSIDCTIDKTELSGNSTIQLDPMADGDFYGLDQTLENGWLLKRLA